MGWNKTYFIILVLAVCQFGSVWIGDGNTSPCTACHQGWFTNQIVIHGNGYSV